MAWKQLAQAIPPVYAELLVGQAAMRACHEWFGVPVMTHDDVQRRPFECKRIMAGWLRGAGDDAASAGMRLMPAAGREEAEVQTATEEGGSVPACKTAPVLCKE